MSIINITHNIIKLIHFFLLKYYFRYLFIFLGKLKFTNNFPVVFNKIVLYSFFIGLRAGVLNVTSFHIFVTTVIDLWM